MVVFNTQPRPRALLEAVPDELLPALASLFPTHRSVEAGEEVHEEEWDVLITFAPGPRRAPHLHVVSFGAIELDMPAFGNDKWLSSFRLRLSGATRATELHMHDGLIGAIRSLARAQLIPHYTAEDPKHYWVAATFEFAQSTWVEIDYPLALHCEPLITAGSDQSVLCMRYRRGMLDGSEGGVCYALPRDETIDKIAWVNAALAEISEIDPERVPRRSEWSSTGAWATPRQRSAQRALEDLRSERTRLLANLDEREAAALADLDAAKTEAQSGLLRLLTNDGNTLEDAVALFMESVGLTVTRMDEVYTEGDRREDLQVEVSENDSWIALVEVKGYQQGAKVNDLMRLLRWKAKYGADHGGNSPSALWHVVNHFRGHAPDTRSTAIPNDDDLSNLFDEQGVLIDTRDLFRAAVDIEAGNTTPEAVRHSLLTAHGRWSHPGPNTTPEVERTY